MYEICMGFTNYGVCHKTYDYEIMFDLFIFADRYLMEPIIDLCINLLTISLNKDNILEVLKMAHFINNEKLLKIATTFSINFQEELNENQQQEWKDFIANNSDCIAKMMTNLILK